MSMNQRLKNAKIPDKQIAIILANFEKLKKAGISEDKLENVTNNIIKMKDLRKAFTVDNSVEVLLKLI